jgi:hypothetical protein
VLRPFDYAQDRLRHSAATLSMNGPSTPLRTSGIEGGKGESMRISALSVASDHQPRRVAVNKATTAVMRRALLQTSCI